MWLACRLEEAVTQLRQVFLAMLDGRGRSRPAGTSDREEAVAVIDLQFLEALDLLRSASTVIWLGSDQEELQTLPARRYLGVGINDVDDVLRTRNEATSIVEAFVQIDTAIGIISAEDKTHTRKVLTL